MEFLPVEIFNLIFEYNFSYHDIYNLMQCSTRLHQLSINNYLWYQFYINEKSGSKSKKHQGEVTEECLVVVKNDMYSHNRFEEFAKFLLQKGKLSPTEETIVQRNPSITSQYYVYQSIQNMMIHKLGFSYTRIKLDNNYVLKLNFKNMTDELRELVKEFGCCQKSHLLDIKYKYQSKKLYYNVVKKLILKNLLKVNFSGHESIILTRAMSEIEKLKQKIQHLEQKQRVKSNQLLYKKLLEKME